MASSDRKIAEGLEHIRQAEKCMKTSFFSRTPDKDGAIAEYDKAAVAFKIARSFDQATNVHVTCAEMQKDVKSYFHAAKSYEAAAMCQKELKEWKKVADFIEQACDLFLEHGTPDTAALCLAKGAKMVEQHITDRAIELYKRAADVANAEDNSRQCAEMVGKAARLLIRQRRLDEAFEAIQMEMEMQSKVNNMAPVYKLAMVLVLIKLHQGDYVAGDQAFQGSVKYAGFDSSEEAQLIGNVLNYYDQADRETVEMLCKKPLFTYLDNDFVKLARELPSRVPGGMATSNKDKPPGGAGQLPDDEGEEEDLSGLL